MKAVISLALVLGLSMVSCKKEAQTAETTNNDTIPTMDSMNIGTAPTADTMNTQSQTTANDSANIQTGDSAGVAAPR